jgi:hypothetical protein
VVGIERLRDGAVLRVVVDDLVVSAVGFKPQGEDRRLASKIQALGLGTHSFEKPVN